MRRRMIFRGCAEVRVWDWGWEWGLPLGLGNGLGMWIGKRSEGGCAGVRVGIGTNFGQDKVSRRGRGTILV